MTSADEVWHIVGAAPAWLTLGDPTTFDGQEVRPVLGDWSDLHSCDRPPKYVSDAPILTSGVRGFDTSPTRQAVRQHFPGLPISAIAGTCSGPVAILFNGPSLASHDLSSLRMPTIGMNRTHQGWPGYVGPQPDYLCIVDWVWFDREDWKAGVLAHPRIINGSSHPADIGYRVVRHPRMSPFSFDLARDGYAGPVPCTTGYLALQLALYLGFTEVFCLGLDMQGGHFDGTKASLHYPSARAHLSRIAKHLSTHRPEVKVWVCGSSDSAVEAFPKTGFDTLLRRAEVAA